MSNAHGKISLVLPSHGTFYTRPDVLDLMIGRHLPASPLQLQAKVAEATGLDYSDVPDVASLLVVLADISGINEDLDAPLLTPWKVRTGADGHRWDGGDPECGHHVGGFGICKCGARRLVEAGA